MSLLCVESVTVSEVTCFFRSAVHGLENTLLQKHKIGVELVLVLNPRDGCGRSRGNNEFTTYFKVLLETLTTSVFMGLTLHI